MKNASVAVMKRVSPASGGELEAALGDRVSTLGAMVRWATQRAKEIQSSDLGKSKNSSRLGIEAIAYSVDQHIRVAAEINEWRYVYRDDTGDEPVLKIDIGNWTDRTWSNVRSDHGYASPSHVIVYAVIENDGSLLFEFQFSPRPKGVSARGQSDELTRRLRGAGLIER